MKTQQDFEAWLRTYPDILDAVIELCREALNAGREHGSIGLIFERLRWESYIRADDDGYKLNNDYAPLMARYLEEIGVCPPNFFIKRARRTPTTDVEPYLEEAHHV